MLLLWVSVIYQGTLITDVKLAYGPVHHGYIISQHDFSHRDTS